MALAPSPAVLLGAAQRHKQSFNPGSEQKQAEMLLCTETGWRAAAQTLAPFIFRLNPAHSHLLQSALRMLS